MWLIKMDRLQLYSNRCARRLAIKSLEMANDFVTELDWHIHTGDDVLSAAMAAVVVVVTAGTPVLLACDDLPLPLGLPLTGCLIIVGSKLSKLKTLEGRIQAIKRKFSTVLVVLRWFKARDWSTKSAYYNRI